MVLWAVYLNYIYLTPHVNECVDVVNEMQECNKASRSIFTHFGGM